MRPLYIFDIDGTIADLSHRLHYIKQDNPDWEAFHSCVSQDAPIQPVIDTVNDLIDGNVDVWFFSGRMDSCRMDTLIWLEENIRKVHGPILEMRRSGDYRPDYKVKQEMLENMLDEDRYRLVAVFDDRKQVVDMWRRNGVTCYQVKDGNY